MRTEETCSHLCQVWPIMLKIITWKKKLNQNRGFCYEPHYEWIVGFYTSMKPSKDRTQSRLWTGTKKRKKERTPRWAIINCHILCSYWFSPIYTLFTQYRAMLPPSAVLYRSTLLLTFEESYKWQLPSWATEPALIQGSEDKCEEPSGMDYQLQSLHGQIQLLSPIEVVTQHVKRGRYAVLSR